MGRLIRSTLVFTLIHLFLMRSFRYSLLMLCLASTLHAQVRTDSRSFDIQPTMAKSQGLHRVIESDPMPISVAGDPFVSIAPSMNFGNNVPSHAHIQLRVSSDGVSWEDWVDAGHDSHAELAPGMVQGNLVFFPATAQFVQFRIVAGLVDILPRSVDLFMVNPGVSAEDDNRAKTLDFEVNTAANYALPVHVPRSSWGGSLNLTNDRSGATPITVTHLWVHHSAGQTTSTNFSAVVRSYYTYHTGSLGWADIGYNWLVDPNGVTYQGREHSLNIFTNEGNPDVRGAHAPGVNGTSMGICVIGDYTNILPSEKAIVALRNMLAWKANEKGMDVLSTRNVGTNNYNIISGHRDDVQSSTACPGASFYPTLPSVRRRVHAFLNPPIVAELASSVAINASTEATLHGVVNPRRSATEWFFEIARNPQFTAATITSGGTFAVGSDGLNDVSNVATGLDVGQTYYYRLYAVNSDTLTVSEAGSFVAGETTSVETRDDGRETMDAFVLEQNYPNPFNPATLIRFSLQSSHVTRLTVYDLMGREIAVLVNGPKAAGTHSIEFDASHLASGVYMYELVADGTRITRLMTLVK